MGIADDGFYREHCVIVDMDQEKKVEWKKGSEEVEGQEKGKTEAESGLRSQLPELVCVEYPGIVNNTGKMIETLGGLETLAQVMEEPNRRLELRFRPDDVFCKPACGERSPASSLLLRVKKKKLKAGREGKGKPAVKFETSIEGVVPTTYRFGSLCDFQYLCMERKDDEFKSLYPQGYFGKSGLVSSSWIETPDVPLFLPPAAFSRMDLAQEYQYRRETTAPTLSTPDNIIGRTRLRRSHHAIFVTYDVDKVPDKPRDVALKQIKLKFIDRDRLKLILPALSYYFTTGPWRNQWIRFGFDPRIEASAALHQTLDYRVRQQGGARSQVAAKRNYANYLLPYKAMNWSKPRTSLISKTSFADQEEVANERGNEGVEEQMKREDVYLFREGRVPPSRQMFYQYGDLQLDEAKEILANSASEVCNEKSGWFVQGTEDRLREALTESINRQLSKQREEEMVEEDKD